MSVTASREEMERTAKEVRGRLWWTFLITGILWLLLGFVVLSFRPASVSITVVLVAVAFWMGALTQLAIATVATGGWRTLALVGAVAGIAAGVGTLVWPDATLLVVALFIAWYLLISGIFEVFYALSNNAVRGWWLGLVSGLVSIALGAWAIGNPDRSVILLISIIGVWAVFRGVSNLMAAGHFRQLNQELPRP
ncbi:MAG TPA: DUF308 domain-containing protein [Acidimicrobiia bacterium]|jgi:uncharacterized membrane protein HdeD (DUF308 family)|nr:DUF308 domain-containing protein [Acidimicrobiia bacterium]